jgi:epoxyqueuosine reductase
MPRRPEDAGGPARPDADGLSDRLKARALEEGFGLAGIARLEPSDHAGFLRSWLDAGYHGDMEYLARPDAVARRVDPRRWTGSLKTALVVADFYPPGAVDAGGGVDGGEPEEAVGLIARYARGRDYHRVVKRKLRRLLRWLESEVGRSLPAARACVDTSPVLERELARRAGLGWFGRNTMLIHPRRGSYFFLGVLLTELDLAADAPFEADHCGTCRACLDACPTGALLGRDANGAPVMDARLCISYLTIEHRGPIPPELRPAIGNRVFGCDICQTCCPWNADKFVQITTEPDYRADTRNAKARPDPPADLPGTEAPSLVALMRMTREDWDTWTRGSAIRRAGYAGFRRNVAVAIGNWLACEGEKPAEAVAVLREAQHDEEPLVREHVAWALERAAG